MSRLLLSKLSPIIHKKSINRLFSSSRTGPCVSICSTVETEGDTVGEVLLYDVENFEVVKAEKTFPRELDDSQLVGASHGWGFFSNTKDGSMVISDFLNPFGSKTKPKMINLPRFTTMSLCQTDAVCNVAMSSSPPEPDDKDWAVGIKFMGKQMSLCRPHSRDPCWTNIRVPFEPWDTSKLMYSKKDKRFNLLAPGGNYLCSWDLLDFDKDTNPKFHELVLHNSPKSPISSRNLFDSFYREDHYVESPSGECFLIKWLSVYKPDGWERSAVMMFREEETKDGKKHMFYTKDIGDLCIFISKGEDFCVIASSCPGLYPNSIFLKGREFGTTNMTKNTFGPYEYPDGTPDMIPHSPYWLPPFST